MNFYLCSKINYSEIPLDSRKEKVLESTKHIPYCLHIKDCRGWGLNFLHVWGNKRGAVRWERKKQVTSCFPFSMTQKKTSQKNQHTQKPRCWLIRNLEGIYGTADETAQEKENTHNRPKAKFWHVSASFLFINSSKCIIVPLLPRKCLQGRNL